MSEPVSIAVDGPVASGKTAVGRRVAQRLGWRFVDTGAMYRAVTRAALEEGTDLGDVRALARLAASLEMRVISGEGGDRLLVNGQDVTEQLRDARIEREVSLVAKVPGVRSAMVGEQRAMAREGPIVMAGRDIGTVVLPEAKVKVFLKASAEERARRRFRELQEMGREPVFLRVKDDLLRRDKIDSERAESPLRPAEAAVQIDTDDVEIEEVVEKIIAMVEGG